MENKFQYKIYNGDELKKNKKLFSRLKKIVAEYEYIEGDIFEELTSESIICCMTSNNINIGFSWIQPGYIYDEAELCWFVVDKQRIKGLDAKNLLDKTIEICKSKFYKHLQFVCAKDAWGKIKDKNKLLSKYGYKLDDNVQIYDVSIKTIDLLEGILK